MHHGPAWFICHYPLNPSFPQGRHTPSSSSPAFGFSPPKGHLDFSQSDAPPSGELDVLACKAQVQARLEEIKSQVPPLSLP